MAKRGGIADLRRQLAAREKGPGKSQARQKGLAEKIEDLGRRIAVLTGEVPKRGLRGALSVTSGRWPTCRGPTEGSAF